MNIKFNDTEIESVMYNSIDEILQGTSYQHLGICSLNTLDDVANFLIENCENGSKINAKFIKQMFEKIGKDEQISMKSILDLSPINFIFGVDTLDYYIKFVKIDSDKFKIIFYKQPPERKLMFETILNQKNQLN